MISNSFCKEIEVIPTRYIINKEESDLQVVPVGDMSIIFPCSFAVGITQQYGIYVLLG